MFPMAGHNVQWIWTGFGVQPPYDLRMVMGWVIFAEQPRDARAPWAAFECLA